jgi:hypothetical protein
MYRNICLIRSQEAIGEDRLKTWKGWNAPQLKWLSTPAGIEGLCISMQSMGGDAESRATGTATATATRAR